MTNKTKPQARTPQKDIGVYTPGPWRVSGCMSGKNAIIEHGGPDTFSPIIAEVKHDDGHLPRNANARLIAAAPDLLAAVKASRDYEGNQTVMSDERIDLMQIQNAAIAKAQGGK